MVKTTEKDLKIHIGQPMQCSPEDLVLIANTYQDVKKRLENRGARLREYDPYSFCIWLATRPEELDRLSREGKKNWKYAVCYRISKDICLQKTFEQFENGSLEEVERYGEHKRLVLERGLTDII